MKSFTARYALILNGIIKHGKIFEFLSPEIELYQMGPFSKQRVGENLRMDFMLWKRSHLIKFNLRKEIFKDFSLLNVPNKDESLLGSEIFHCLVGSKTYI